MIDPQDYADITAKRPELAVDGLVYGKKPRSIREDEHWFQYSVRSIMQDEAEALIGWHWTKMLPPGHSLKHTEAAWSVKIADSRFGWIGFHDDPLSALAAFWRQYT